MTTKLTTKSISLIINLLHGLLQNNDDGSTKETT